MFELETMTEAAPELMQASATAKPTPVVPPITRTRVSDFQVQE